MPNFFVTVPLLQQLREQDFVVWFPKNALKSKSIWEDGSPLLEMVKRPGWFEWIVLCVQWLSLLISRLADGL